MTFSHAGVPEPGQSSKKRGTRWAGKLLQCTALLHSDLPHLRSGEEKSCGLVPAQVQILSPALLYTTMKDAKQEWLSELAEFIVEGHMRGWAAEGSEIEPIFPGMKSIYYQRGSWEYRDNYFDYFRAPGFTVISQDNKPVWMMAYFGAGITPRYEQIAKPAFAFLRRALMQVTPDMPFRGPSEYKEKDWAYRFKLVRGSIEDFLWEEEILSDGDLVFAQTGGGGIGIAKDVQRQPIYPWNV